MHPVLLIESDRNHLSSTSFLFGNKNLADQLTVKRGTSNKQYGIVASTVRQSNNINVGCQNIFDICIMSADSPFSFLYRTMTYPFQLLEEKCECHISGPVMIYLHSLLLI